jgi:hypothetical protein
MKADGLYKRLRIDNLIELRADRVGHIDRIHETRYNDFVTTAASDSLVRLPAALVFPGPHSASRSYQHVLNVSELP